jgi:hypothetical protein
MTARAGRAAGPVIAAAVLAVLAVLAGCGSSPGASGPGGPARSAPAVPLDLSLVDPGGTSWAVVEMGGASAQQENFWQVLVRPAAAATWRLATPAGVADNGGVVVASPSAGALLAGFRPSQDLTFSPLAATSDAGARWAPGGPVSGGLADVPGALAAGPGGELLAVTGGGDAELGTGPGAGARWTRLATVRGLAATAAGRACGLTAITAAAFTAAGGPLLGGTCATPGVVGVFAWRDGTWQAAVPARPAALRDRDVQVLRLGGSMALLAVGRGAHADVIAAWLAGGGSQWRLSPPLPAGSGAGRPAVRSASLWPGGAAGLVLAGSRGERGATIAGPGAAWAVLPALPAGTATLARGAGGTLEALAVARSAMAAWRLGGAVPGWTPFQQVRVPIPYGSSS